MFRQSKVVLGFMAVFKKEFVPERKHEIVGTHVQKHQNLGNGRSQDLKFSKAVINFVRENSRKVRSADSWKAML